MHIHLPLVLEAIIFSWIALYWLIYKILLRKKLSPLLVSLIANSDYGFMKVLSWSAIRDTNNGESFFLNKIL